MNDNQTLVPDSVCNICMRTVASGDNEKNCVGHNQIGYGLWNQEPEYKDYQQFLINKKRQQLNMPSLEFQPRSKKFTGE